MSCASFIGTSLWLSVWVNAYSRDEAVNIAFYLGVYGAISLGEVVADGFVVLTYANGSWFAAKKLHEMFIHAMMNAPLSWYRTVPVGRIVNRFSRDMMALDNTISRVLMVFMEDFIKLFLSVGAVSSILPIFMLPALVTCFLGVVAGEMYTRTAGRGQAPGRLRPEPRLLAVLRHPRRPWPSSAPAPTCPTCSPTASPTTCAPTAAPPRPCTTATAGSPSGSTSSPPSSWAAPASSPSPRPAPSLPAWSASR